MERGRRRQMDGEIKGKKERNRGREGEKERGRDEGRG